GAARGGGRAREPVGGPWRASAAVLLAASLASAGGGAVAPALAEHVPACGHAAGRALLVALLAAPAAWYFAARPLARAGLAGRLRAERIVGNATDAVLTVDRSGRVEWLNPAAEMLFRYRAAEGGGRPTNT